MSSFDTNVYVSFVLVVSFFKAFSKNVFMAEIIRFVVFFFLYY